MTPALELTDISRGYGGLRPLRIHRLAVNPAERIAILGFDAPMAETFVNLVTGATLPDRGIVSVYGRPTTAIADGVEWLTFVDQFGIVTDRAVMLEGLSVMQNLALAFTLDIEPPSGEARIQAADLAREVGLPESVWEAPFASLDGASRTCVRIARAVALNPVILLLEHATATVDRDQVPSLASRIRSVAERRSAAVVAVTADRTFAESLSGRIGQLDPASGRIAERGGNRWFGRRLG